MLKLYDRETSGNAYKIRLLLSFLDIPHERIPVSIKDGRNQVDDAYLTLNPRGQIPTIQEDEFSLWGSTAILCYLASRYDKTACWLPRDPAQFGQVMQWLELAQNKIQTDQKHTRANEHQRQTGEHEAAQQTAGQALGVLESRLGAAQWV